MSVDEKIRLLFDGTEYEVSNKSNLVDAMDEQGIKIMAPCYRNNRSEGCCKACIVEVNGKREYACGLKPAEGMDITYNREDLIQARKEAAKKYASQTVEENCCDDTGCGCSTPSEASSCC